MAKHKKMSKPELIAHLETERRRHMANAARAHRTADFFCCPTHLEQFWDHAVRDTEQQLRALGWSTLQERRNRRLAARLKREEAARERRIKRSLARCR